MIFQGQTSIFSCCNLVRVHFLPVESSEQAALLSDIQPTQLTVVCEVPIMVGTLANLLSWSICIDGYHLQTYRFNQQVLIDGDKKVLFERQPVGDYFHTMLVSKVIVDRHLHNHIGCTIDYCGRCPNPIVAYNTYRYTPKPAHCGPQQVSILIISDLSLAQQPIRSGIVQGIRRNRTAHKHSAAKHCRLEPHIDAETVITALLWRPSAAKLLHAQQ